jgi:hypothetical protein
MVMRRRPLFGERTVKHIFLVAFSRINAPLVVACSRRNAILARQCRNRANAQQTEFFEKLATI